MGEAFVRVEGAREHNLRGVSLRIPHLRLNVFAGVSGSGKSSLALDTLFAEGRRRYMESLSTRARQLLGQLRRPSVDRITGLSPTIAVLPAQAAGGSPRSTVGTASELHDHLRVLFARVGVQGCHVCGLTVGRHDPDRIRREAGALAEGTRLLVLAPLARARPGACEDLLREAFRAGFSRVRVDGAQRALGVELGLDPAQPHDIDLVVDRLIVRPGKEDRLTDSVETAMRAGRGEVILALVDGPELRFSEHLRCDGCGTSFPELTSSSFSFNTPQGCCPTCSGLGVALSEGGDPGAEPCPACHGSRLRPESAAVQVGGRTLPELLRLPLEALPQALAELGGSGPLADAVDELIDLMLQRLRFLGELGLGYLPLARPTAAVSAGERRRLRLAVHLGAELSGVTYVLDEPAAGLHPRDVEGLVVALQGLRGQGNTLIVVEHAPQVLRAADRIFEIGPGAGLHGGRLVAQGSPAELGANPDSLTGAYLSGRRTIGPRAGAARGGASAWLRLQGCTGHNLSGVDLRLPLGRLVGVAGVSGSGKSSLVDGTLYPAVTGHLRQSRPRCLPHEGLQGWEALDAVVRLDQRPIGRSERSNAATYTGAWGLLRELYASTREARARGFGAKRFSFNATGGACTVCRGHGVRRVPMHFLPDGQVPCEACGGKRFNAATLQVRYRGLSVADVLELPCGEAAQIFSAHPKLHRVLDTLRRVGLGYLPLGQPAATLSAGEAQRVRLATELARRERGRTLYLLDEPARGLHPADVSVLLTVLQELVERGNTVVLVEHSAELLARTDWLVELGPGAGPEGGRIVAQGPPALVAQSPDSPSAPWLRPHLEAVET